MTMSSSIQILCLTGWQQPSDALADIAPNALHFDYGAYDRLDVALAALPHTPELVIGWSLGAFIAMEAIARGICRPRQLLLLGAKYQYASDAAFPHGASRERIEETRRHYMSDPQGMLRQFQSLIAKGDEHERSIMHLLHVQGAPLWPQGPFWLDQLRTLSCRAMDMNAFPPTHIVHGTMDVITPPEHAQCLHKALPASTLEIWPRCAHAPHLHDPERLRAIIASYV